MRTRPGTSLVEILIAIFVMGIGLLAVLTLFPLGAMRMQEAIEDDRAMALARQAEAVTNMFDVRYETKSTVPGLFNPANPFMTPPFSTPPGGTGSNLPVDPEGPSYPVSIDPIGVRSSVQPFDRWLAGTPGTIPRRTISSMATNAAALRWFTMQDEINFAIDGTPRFVTGTTFERDVRRSYAFLAQRPRAADPSVVELSVVVFNRRPINMNLAAAISLNETAFTARYDTVRNVVTLVLTGTPPNIRAGDWIPDATPVVTTVGGVTYRTAHGNFYRVVSIRGIGAGNTNAAGNELELEVQQPLRDFAGTTIAQTPANSGIYTGAAGNGSLCRAIVLEGVSQVFEKGVATRHSPRVPSSGTILP